MIKVAIIDDDFNEKITLSDLKKTDDDNILDALEDINPPEYEIIYNYFSEMKLVYNSLEDIVNIFNSTKDISSLPRAFLRLRDKALERKELLIAPVKRIINWLCTSGLSINESDIDIYSSPSSYFNERKSLSYDLICIDYLLVNDSEQETIPFINNIKNESAEQGYTPSFILMSSHENLITNDFLDIKSKLSMTSSRFRIMEKPSTNLNSREVIWKTTFKQIFEQKKFIHDIEMFIHGWINHFQIASLSLAKILWALDAHSLDVLRRTAKDDNISFSEYFTEVIFKKVLAEFESSLNTGAESVRSSGETLQTVLENNILISPGNEVQDSRLILKTLLKDTNWHERNWYQIQESYPVLVNEACDLPSLYHYQLKWLKENLRFGIVLRNKETKTLLVNLTQPCDLAHLKPYQIDKINLFFMQGLDIHMSINNTTDKQALSTALFVDSSWRNVHWDLSRPLTPPIISFMQKIENYETIGQLRHEQSQHILNRYVAKISRVATIRMPYLFDIKYLVIAFDEKGEVNIKTKGVGHAIKTSEKNITVSFSPEHASTIESNLPLPKSIFEDLVSGFVIPQKGKLRLPASYSMDNIYLLNKCYSEKEALKQIDANYKSSLIREKINYLFIYND